MQRKHPTPSAASATQGSMNSASVGAKRAKKSGLEQGEYRPQVKAYSSELMGHPTRNAATTAKIARRCEKARGEGPDRCMQLPFVTVQPDLRCRCSVVA
jgi:hypothetical protein